MSPATHRAKFLIPMVEKKKVKKATLLSKESKVVKKQKSTAVATSSHKKKYLIPLVENSTTRVAETVEEKPVVAAHRAKFLIPLGDGKKKKARPTAVPIKGKQYKVTKTRAGRKPTTFPRFSSLPPELRHKIWSFSLPGPRIIRLKSFAKATPSSSSSSPTWNDTHETRAYARYPAVLAACSESRSITSDALPLAFGSSLSRPVRVNFDLDTFYLWDSRSLRSISQSGSSRDLAVLQSKVAKLAICKSQLDEEMSRTVGKMGGLKEFQLGRLDGIHEEISVKMLLLEAWEKGDAYSKKGGKMPKFKWVYEMGEKMQRVDGWKGCAK